MEMALFILNSFKIWSQNSDQNVRTTSRGDLEYSGQKKPERTFSI